LHIDEWELYEELISSQSLKSIEIYRPAINEDWFDPFIKIKSLEEIDVSDNLSMELEVFPNLKKINFLNMYYLFSHSIVNLKGLIGMPSLENSSMRRSDLYPEITFFANSMSPDIEGHPFYEINKSIRAKLEVDSTYSGIMIVTFGDAFPMFIGSNKESNAVAMGEVLNGKPVGVWEFNLPQLRAFMDDFSYYYNYSDTAQVSFPMDGEWRYYYPDGTLAISGQFKNGLKKGEWKFYNPDGFLVNTKSFNKGKPLGLFISYEMYEGSLNDSRTYFFSDKEFIYGGELKNGLYRIGNLWNQSYPSNNYSLDQAGNLSKFKNEVFVKSVRKDSFEYNRVIKDYLKKLYPDKKLSKKDVSFED